MDDEAILTPDLLRLTRWIADYYLCGWGQVLNAVVPAGARQQAGTKLVALLEPVPESELPEPLPRLTSKQRVVLEELRKRRGPVDSRRLARLAQCGRGPIDGLVAKGLARRVERRVEQEQPIIEGPGVEEPALTLSSDQLQAWASIQESVQRGGFHAFLLYGVTGSGKTELYLRALEEVVRQGKQAIVLVPEISLTPQTIERFRGRCGDVAVLHSHLGNAQRGQQWRRIASGQAQAIVGAGAPCLHRPGVSA